ncbi:MAG: hypothetical protein R3F15_06250 [Lysobacterales bacterium]
MIDYRRAFTNGHRFVNPDDAVTFEVRVSEVGRLALPSGRLSLFDASDLDDTIEPALLPSLAVQPGMHRVLLSRAYPPVGVVHAALCVLAPDGELEQVAQWISPSFDSASQEVPPQLDLSEGEVCLADQGRLLRQWRSSAGRRALRVRFPMQRSRTDLQALTDRSVLSGFWLLRCALGWQGGSIPWSIGLDRHGQAVGLAIDGLVLQRLCWRQCEWRLDTLAVGPLLLPGWPGPAVEVVECGPARLIICHPSAIHLHVATDDGSHGCALIESTDEHGEWQTVHIHRPEQTARLCLAWNDAVEALR